MATAMVKAKMALFPEIIVIPHFDNRPCVLVNQVRHILRVLLRVGLHRLDPDTLPSPVGESGGCQM
jgi:hypothetical protein